MSGLNPNVVMGFCSYYEKTADEKTADPKIVGKIMKRLKAGKMKSTEAVKAMAQMAKKKK